MTALPAAGPLTPNLPSALDPRQNSMLRMPRRGTSSYIRHPDENNAALMIEALYKSYGNHEVLKNVNFVAEPNRVYALIGHNGAGKTTLMDLIAGVSQPNKGSIRFSKKGKRQNVAIAPQETGVYLALTVWRNIYLEARSGGFSRKEARERSEQLIDAFHLQEVRNRMPQTLSGGMRRRVHLAMTLVQPAEVYLLDEPTNGLDFASRAAVLSIVRDTTRQNDAAVLFTSHNGGEIELLADEISFLDDGKVSPPQPIKTLMAKAGTHVGYAEFVRRESCVDFAGRLRGGHGFGRVFVDDRRLTVELCSEHAQELITELCKDRRFRVTEFRVSRMDIDGLALLSKGSWARP